MAEFRSFANVQSYGALPPHYFRETIIVSGYLINRALKEGNTRTILCSNGVVRLGHERGLLPILRKKFR